MVLVSINMCEILFIYTFHRRDVRVGSKLGPIGPNWAFLKISFQYILSRRAEPKYTETDLKVSDLSHLGEIGPNFEPTLTCLFHHFSCCPSTITVPSNSRRKSHLPFRYILSRQKIIYIKMKTNPLNINKSTEVVLYNIIFI